MTEELCDLTGSELAARIAGGEVTATEVVESSLRRIEAVDDEVRAFLTRTPEVALERAAELDAHRGTGAPQHAVAGIPLALKDVLATQDPHVRLADPRGVRAAVRVHRLGASVRARQRADGKTNCDEFAMGSSNENSAFGAVRNPWDLERVPGGSSGGSAAAVATGEVVWALGTDTGGSVRQPASLSGVVGLKPTYGLISRYGLIAFASSLDTVGTLTRSVRDAAVLLSAMAGKDHRDATSLDEPVPDYVAGLDGGVAGLRIGVVAEAFGEGVEPGVRDAVRAAVDRLDALGAEVGDASLPHAEYTLSAYYLIAPSEASSNLARYDGVRYGYRAEGGEDSVDMMSRTRARASAPR